MCIMGIKVHGSATIKTGDTQGCHLPRQVLLYTTFRTRCSWGRGGGGRGVLIRTPYLGIYSYTLTRRVGPFYWMWKMAIVNHVFLLERLSLSPSPSTVPQGRLSSNAVLELDSTPLPLPCWHLSSSSLFHWTSHLIYLCNQGHITIRPKFRFRSCWSSRIYIAQEVRGSTSAAHQL